MTRFNKRRGSGNYLQHILNDSTKPFLYRTNLRLLLGMPELKEDNRILSAAAPPIEFTYAARRFQNKFKMDSVHLTSKTTASAFYPHKSRQNGHKEMGSSSFTQTNDTVESSSKSYSNNNQGKAFPGQSESQKGPTETQQIFSIAQDESTTEATIFKKGDNSAPVSESNQTEKDQSPSLRIVAIPGITTSSFIPTLVHEFENNKAIPEKSVGKPELYNSTGVYPTKNINLHAYTDSPQGQEQKSFSLSEMKEEKDNKEIGIGLKKAAKKTRDNHHTSAAIPNMESRPDAPVPLTNLRQNVLSPTLPLAHIETTSSPSASRFITLGETNENRKTVLPVPAITREELSLPDNTQRNDSVELREEAVRKAFHKHFTAGEKNYEIPAITSQKTSAKNTMLALEGNILQKILPAHSATAYSMEPRKIKSGMREMVFSDVSTTTFKPIHRQEEGLNIAERIEQIQKTARELTLKNVLQKNTDNMETKENEPRPRPHAAFPVRKIFIVQKQGRKMTGTSIFWQRNCLGRFHLRPLR